MNSLKGRLICLVSSSHLGSNPRLVKAADALQEAGARVHVIAVDPANLVEVQSRDAAILAKAKWSAERISRGGTWRRLFNGVLRRLCQQLFVAGVTNTGVALRAYSPLIPALAAAAALIDADLYIAHNLPALPAAWLAAQRRGKKVIFDAEDFHSGQLPDDALHAKELQLTRWIEQRYLPLVACLTAASPGIAKAYAATCNVDEPTVVLNVFPLAQAPTMPTASGTVTPAPSLYWFSQTIGPQRGLETVIAALALSRCRPVLYLQGSLAAGYAAVLDELASHEGVRDRVVVLPSVLPDELPGIAARYDAGVASEIAGFAVNPNIALSNKVFTFLLAGIPVLASDTQAQTALAHAAGEVVQLYPQADAPALAKAMDAVLGDPQRLAALRRQAWQLGQQRYNWDLEQAKVLAVVSHCLAQ